MKSTLLVGDYLFASKFSYGYSRYSFPFGLIPFQGRLFGSEPKRGDVVIFKLPRDNETDYIKRVIGLPGDEILVRDGIVYLNGQALPQTPAGTYLGPEEGGRTKPRFEETLPNGVKHYVLHWGREAELDNVGPFKVPAGHYFMMGDNRDDSIDSRVPSTWRGVGFVPYENLVGRAEIVFFSAAVDDPKAFRLTSPWTCRSIFAGAGSSIWFAKRNLARGVVWKALMLRILGRANSFNVRKVLWLCDELGVPFEREDWGRGYQYVVGETFTIGDIPIGLVVNRWFCLNFERPAYPAVAAYYDLLGERPAYRRHVRNGLP